VGFGSCERCGRSIRADGYPLLANDSVCSCCPLHSESVPSSPTMLEEYHQNSMFWYDPLDVVAERLPWDRRLMAREDFATP
jgi:hypothetical protein